MSLDLNVRTGPSAFPTRASWHRPTLQTCIPYYLANTAYVLVFPSTLTPEGHKIAYLTNRRSEAPFSCLFLWISVRLAEDRRSLYYDRVSIAAAAAAVAAAAVACVIVFCCPALALRLHHGACGPTPHCHRAGGPDRER